MQQKPLLIAALAGSALLLWSACTKPTPFGAELLEEQVADFAYTDTLTLQCTITREDSIITSDRSSTADYFLCGQLHDPVFGKAEAEIYSLFQLSVSNPKFDSTVLDSAVLYLRYDVKGFYGDTSQTQNIRVQRLNEQLRWDSDYYSNKELAAGAEIGRLDNFLPRPSTPLTLFDTSAAAARAPYISIPLNDDFARELLEMDSLNMTEDTLFWKTMQGLKITATPNGTPGAMMAFDLNDPDFSFIRLYYHRDTVYYAFDYFFLGCNKFVAFKHDYSGSTVENAINQPSNDFLFAQGMGGLRVKVEIPYVDRLEHIAVNKAELVLTAATLPGDNPLLTPAEQLVFTESRGDTAYVFTSDVTYSLGPTLGGGFNLFGGIPEKETDPGTGEQVTRYHLTLTQRIQQMVDDTSDDIRNRTIYFNVYPQRSTLQRGVFYGPQSGSYPARLTLKYTSIQ